MRWRRTGSRWGAACSSSNWVGESRTFGESRAFLESHGVEVVDMDMQECVDMMNEFIEAEPVLWNEDIMEE